MDLKALNILIFASFILFSSTSCVRDIDEVVNSEEESVVDNYASNHESDSDYVWEEEDVIPVVLNGSSISSDGKGLTISGGVLTITSAGTYGFTGSLSDGQIIVNTEDTALVRIILNGVNIESQTSSAIKIENASKTLISLADGSENVVSDAVNYSLDIGPNAAIYSSDDLTISGNGSLHVNGNYNDGICSKDGLIVDSGTITVSAIDDGIRGKDYLIVKSGNITVVAGGDGLKSDNDDDEDKGNITIVDGSITVKSGGDAIAANSNVWVKYGNLDLTSGNGSSSLVGATSCKGIKAGVAIEINDGGILVDAADDAIHCDMNILIEGGTIQLASGDDGIHSEIDTYINGGTLNITKSYEGIESALGSCYITSGTIYIVASDDGINISAGGSSNGGGPGRKSAAITTESTYALAISGGYIFIDCEGDGLDSNDLLAISGGTMLVNSAEYNENSALDYDGECIVSGGLLVGIGVSQMSEAPGATSTQYSFLIDFNDRIASETIIHFEDENGNDLLTYQSIKSFNSIAFSSPNMDEGSTILVYIGGSSTGTVNNGLYTDGTYSGGMLYSSFTISSMVTKKNI